MGEITINLHEEKWEPEAWGMEARHHKQGGNRFGQKSFPEETDCFGRNLKIKLVWLKTKISIWKILPGDYGCSAAQKQESGCFRLYKQDS